MAKQLANPQTDLATLDMSRGELWETNSQGPYFARLRAEKPVHYCPESGAFRGAVR